MDEAEIVDERDLRWEAMESVFRVIVFDGSSTAAYDLYGTFHEAFEWASSTAGSLPYRLGVVAERDGEKGVCWLVLIGDDPNQNDQLNAI